MPIVVSPVPDEIHESTRQDPFVFFFFSSSSLWQIDQLVTPVHGGLTLHFVDHNSAECISRLQVISFEGCFNPFVIHVCCGCSLSPEFTTSTQWLWPQWILVLCNVWPRVGSPNIRKSIFCSCQEPVDWWTLVHELHSQFTPNRPLMRTRRSSRLPVTFAGCGAKPSVKAAIPRRKPRPGYVPSATGITLYVGNVSTTIDPGR